MTPQEKARKLIDNFKPYMYCYIGSGMLSNDYDNRVVINFAQKCVLISINEILETLNNQQNIDNIQISYWNEVKEIVKNKIEW